MTKPKTLPFTVDQFLKMAAKHIGYRESPKGSNRTIFGERYAKRTRRGSNGVAWCGIFVWDIFLECGIDIQKELGFRFCQYTPTFSEDCRKAGWQRVSAKDIRPGDVVFFDFPDKVRPGEPQHVGIAGSTVKAGWFRTKAEGNTSKGITGSQDNGGGVYSRLRRSKYVIAAYRPPFATHAVSPVPAKSVPKPITVVATLLASGGLLYGGNVYLKTNSATPSPAQVSAPAFTRVLRLTSPAMRGSDVATVRRALLHDSGTVYDAKLERAVRAWETRHGIVQTGTWGCTQAQAAGWTCRAS